MASILSANDSAAMQYFNVSLDCVNNSTSAYGNATNETIYQWTLPLGGSIFLICDTTISATWAVTANLLVIISFLRDPKLRIIQNYYIVSLAFSDFLMGGFVLPIGLYGFLYGGSGGGWPIQSKALCKFWSFMDFTNSLQSSMTVSLISYDRFKMVIFPINYRNEESPKRAMLRIAASWTFSVLFYGPTTLFWDILQGYSVLAYDECDSEFRDVIWINAIQSCVEFLIPLIVICICNVSLFLYIRKRRVRMLQVRREMQKNAEAITTGDGSDSTNNEKRGTRKQEKKDTETKNAAEIREIRKEQKATRSLMILVGSYFILWFWYEIIGNFLSPICKDCVSTVLYEASYWPQYHICCLNPLIYAITIERFRYHFLAFFSHIFPCFIQHPSDSSKSGHNRVAPLTSTGVALAVPSVGLSEPESSKP